MSMQEALEWFNRKYWERITRYTVADARTEAYLVAAKCISHCLYSCSDSDSDDEYYEGANE